MRVSVPVVVVVVAVAVAVVVGALSGAVDVAACLPSSLRLSVSNKLT